MSVVFNIFYFGRCALDKRCGARIFRREKKKRRLLAVSFLRSKDKSLYPSPLFDLTMMDGECQAFILSRASPCGGREGGYVHKTG